MGPPPQAGRLSVGGRMEQSEAQSQREQHLLKLLQEANRRIEELEKRLSRND